jgi:hypothetical protein
MVFDTGFRALWLRMQGHIPPDAMIFRRLAMPVNEWKANPITQAFEAKVKNLLKGELKRRGVTYAQLAAKLADIGVQETERNLNNKISRGGFTAAFLVECLQAIGCHTVHLEDA